MSLTRIPLDIVVTATGERTPGKIVAVMADELDALEAELERFKLALIETQNPGIDMALVKASRANAVHPELED